MEVVGADGKVVPHVYCIGDANGKYMLAHAASAQGISAIENMLGRPHLLNHLSVPAACFTHPEVSFVGVTQDKAEEMAAEKGFKLGVAKTSFKANSKVGVGRGGVGMVVGCIGWKSSRWGEMANHHSRRQQGSGTAKGCHGGRSSSGCKQT